MAETNNLLGLDVNFSAQNAWYALLPLENILGPKYSNINLHLTHFSIPQMQQSSTHVSYKGYQKEIPTKVINAGTKEINLEYIIDEKWSNYKALYHWISGITGQINKIVKDDIEPIQPSDYIPLHIYLLDNDKVKVIEFIFHNCWIKYFNAIQLEAQTSEIVKHSFTFVYDKFEISEI